MSRFQLLLCLAMLCGGCSESEAPMSDADFGTIPAPIDASEPLPPLDIEAPRPGWSLRSDEPYPRLNHSAVFDSDRNRMLVFGGGANDVWAFELAGEHANTWSQITVRGAFPPVHYYSDWPGLPTTRDAAIYAPERHSMIVVINSLPTVTATVEQSEVWELALEGTPAWSRIATLEAPDGAEIQSGAAVYDPREQRLLALGGQGAQSGLWSLSLKAESTPQWTRVAGTPQDQQTYFNGHALALDEARNRVILVGGVPRVSKIWALDLEDARWQLLDEGNEASSSYGQAVAIDPVRDALVIVGGDQQFEAAAIYSFADQRWESISVPKSFVNASVVHDAARDRLVLFGGADGATPSNETWQLALASQHWERLGAISIPRSGTVPEQTLVYDPERDAVIAFGGYAGPTTRALSLEHATSAWSPLAAGGTPAVSYTAAIYDPGSSSIISFGGYAYHESNQLSRLPSSEGARWQTMQADGETPVERSGHVMVYDEQHQRAIVFGGARETSYPPREDLDDVWALSLEGTPAWTQLTPDGPAPTAGQGTLAIYDPRGHRMLAYKGNHLTALELDSEPHWSAVGTTGTKPGQVGSGATLYDPESHSMIVLKHDDTGTAVFALDLSSLVWRKYCPETITPAASSAPTRTSNAVLVPDGIYMELGEATYRFDLAAPFCDPS